MEVTTINSFYSREILYFIDAESSHFVPLTTDKFTRAGIYFEDLAAALDYSFQRWLNNWLNQSYGENEYCEVEPDWSDWLDSRTQQSVSVAFLTKYQDQERSSNDYPETRASSRPEFLEEPGAFLDPAVAIATTHAEDIVLWSNLIFKALAKTNSITFSELTLTLDLTPAQIYLGIVLSDRFTLFKDNEDDFYSGFSLSIMP